MCVFFVGKPKVAKAVGEDNSKDVFTLVYGSKEMFMGFACVMDAIGMTLAEDVKSLKLDKFKHTVDLGGGFSINKCAFLDT